MTSVRMEKDHQAIDTVNNSSIGGEIRADVIDRSEVDGGDPTTTKASFGTTSSSSSFLLQWGNRKRLRCMKVEQRSATARVDRHSNYHSPFNLRQRCSLPQRPPQRVLRNTQTTAMRGQGNGSVRRLASSPDKKANNENHNNGNNNNKAAVSSDKGGSSSASGEAGGQPVVWPRKFLLALTNKEKEEDFYAFKGCAKLPQRPKKRAKFIQRTLNMVSPGQWLCDLTLERYEVREKKTSKKRPRGLKAMIKMDSDSE